MLDELMLPVKIFKLLIEFCLILCIIVLFLVRKMGTWVLFIVLIVLFACSMDCQNVWILASLG